MLPRFFEQSNDLFTLHARKALQEFLDRVAGLDVIEKALHWDTRPDKDRLPAENVRILRYDLAHSLRITQRAESSSVRKAGSDHAACVMHVA